MTIEPISDERLAEIRANVNFAESYTREVVAFMTADALALLSRLDKAEAALSAVPRMRELTETEMQALKVETMRPGPILPYREEAEWQPIETAPRDGTRILATGMNWNDESKGRWSEILSWDDDCGDWETDNGESVYPPTHWMALPGLPPPPSSES